MSSFRDSSHSRSRSRVRPARSRALFRWAVASLVIAPLSCSSDAVAGPTAVIASIVGVTLSSTSLTLAVGQTAAMTATAMDATGKPAAFSGTWSSSVPTVASVSPAGMVSALLPGQTTITAAVGGQSASASVTVTSAGVASVSVSPANATHTTGETFQLTATPADANGAALTGRVVTWSTSNGSVASVSTTGLVTAGAPGTATITAASEGKSGTAAITVTGVPIAAIFVSPTPVSVNVGTTAQLTATAVDGLGNTLGGRTIDWSSSSAAVASVTTSGVVSGVGVGAVTITAAAEGRSGTSAVTVVAAASLSVTTSALPNASRTLAYSQTLVSAGGAGTKTWSISSGSLPAGLALSSSGVVSGTPTAVGASTFTVEVQSGDGQTATKSLSITVAQPLLGIATGTLAAASIGVPYSQLLAAVGGDGTYTWSLISGSLPAGITLATGTGFVTGTPTTAATSTFTVQARSGDGQTATQSLSIVVGAGFPALVVSTTTLPGGTRTAPYATSVSATGGNGTNTWSTTGGTLPAGLSLTASNGVISGTPTAAGTSNFTVQAHSGDGQNATKALSIVIAQPLLGITTASLAGGSVGVAYSQTVAATGGDQVYTWSILSGALPTGLTIAASTGVISGTPTAIGTANFTVQVVSGDGQFNTQALSIAITSVFPALSVTTASLPNGTRTVSYSQGVASTGGSGSNTWSISAGVLPAGLSIGSSSGIISGTPTAAGAQTFTAQVHSSDGQTATKSFSITIVQPTLSLTTVSLAAGAVGTAYSQTLAASGGDQVYTWSMSSGTLPAGLTLAPSTGIISGTPTASGTANFTVQVQSGDGQTSAKALSIAVAATFPTLVVSTTSLPNGTRAVAYSQSVGATGGNGANTWTISVGSLPTGLTIASSTGIISGTPTVAGTSNFTVQVQSGDGQTATKALSITIVYATLSVTTTSLAGATVGAPYSQSAAATGGDAVYTWTISVGSLPAGLSIASSTGIISGTPTAAGTVNFTARVQSGDGQTATKALSIVVAPAAFPTLVVSTASLPNGTRTVAYSQSVSATGGNGVNTWTISVGSLPTGLTIASSTGLISGTPTAAATSNFTVQDVSGDGQTATKALSITIAQPVLNLATTTLAGGTQNAAYSQTAAATGGSGSYTWSVSVGALPTGLTIAGSTGVISGTPTVAGTVNFTLQVVSTDGQTATKALSITIAAASSGQTIFFQEAFEDNSLTNRGWYDNSAAFTTTTAEHHGGVASMAAAFTAGGSKPSWGGVRHQFTPSNEVYISYWVKYSTNWVGSGVTFDPHEFHLITNEDGMYANSVTHLSLDIEHNWQTGLGGGVPSLGWEDVANIDQTKINVNLVGVTESRAVAGCNGNADGYPAQCYNAGSLYANGKVKQASTAYFLNNSALPGYKNNWHHVEAYFKLNTISGGTGQLDGVAQYWFDGALVIDLHNIQYRTGIHTTMLFNQLTFTPFFGNGSPVAQTAWYDDLIIANHP